MPLLAPVTRATVPSSGEAIAFKLQPRFFPGRGQLALDDVGLVRDLQAPFQHRDRLVRPPA